MITIRGVELNRCYYILIDDEWEVARAVAVGGGGAGFQSSVGLIKLSSPRLVVLGLVPPPDPEMIRKPLLGAKPFQPTVA